MNIVDINFEENKLIIDDNDIRTVYPDVEEIIIRYQPEPTSTKVGVEYEDGKVICQIRIGLECPGIQERD